MASWSAIGAVSEAIKIVLEAHAREIPLNPPVRIFRTSDFATPFDGTEGISIYLYRVSVNASNRNSGPRTGPTGARFRGPSELDLHYLISPWARSAVVEHELLGWLIQTLEDYPMLPTDEVVDIVAQPLALAEGVSVWEFNKAVMQTSMTYLVRMVRIDSKLPLPENKRTQTRESQGNPL